MKRWNGWGDDSITYPLPPAAADFLTERVGPGTPPQDARLTDVLTKVPPSRLPQPPATLGGFIKTAAQDRLCHARGHSLPDWVALRSGRLDTFPDAVAYPTNEEQVAALLRYGQEAGLRLIPYGGGTSVVGHINALADQAPVLTIDMGRLNRLHRLNEANHLATFGAGILGPDLEAHLRAHGFTLGHFPQSFEYSTLGGWIATRSSGQQSLRYGRIEQLFAGGRLETPRGSLELPPFPASAAGPDLRELVLGSEGRLGILTEATVRITPLPAREDFHTVFFPDFERGCAAVRQISQARLPLSLLRLSTAVETETMLALAGHEFFLGLLERYLSLRRLGPEKCMLLLGLTGDDIVATTRKAALGIAAEYGGVHIGRTFGRQWHKGRFQAPYLRNTLWEMGYAVDTLETATGWDNVPAMIGAIVSALHGALSDFNERVHVFTHLSHLYPTGSSVYTTYLFRIARDAEETVARWQRLKRAASEAVVAHGGTISHQHGVGTDHAPYLEAEKGELGQSAITAVLAHFDPLQMMNPGKLMKGGNHVDYVG